jgi:hypothetical protein
MVTHRIVTAGLTMIVLATGVIAPAWADRALRAERDDRSSERGDRDRDRNADQRIQKSTRDSDRNYDNRHGDKRYGSNRQESNRILVRERDGDRIRERRILIVDRDGDRDRDRRPQLQERPRGYVLDKRHDHGRYYPPTGYRVPSLPRTRYTVPYRGRPYYYDRGVWYHYTGVRYVVVLPPVGIGVPVLPPYYTTVWVGGIPYYYANGVYYVWRPAQRVYVVSEPPPESEVHEQPADPQQLFVYPKQGQSEQQQATDRYQCHTWSTGQTGFDPTRSGGNVPEAQYDTKRSDYQRAMKACLEARGYSVQ